MVSSVKSDERPNFLWLNTHDLSARHLGCYGDTYAKTPNLDKLVTLEEIPDTPPPPQFEDEFGNILATTGEIIESAGEKNSSVQDADAT